MVKEFRRKAALHVVPLLIPFATYTAAETPSAIWWAGQPPKLLRTLMSQPAERYLDRFSRIIIMRYPMFSRFGIVPACDGRTDGRSDRRTDTRRQHILR